MAIIDDLSDEAKGMMNDPDKKEHIEKLAKEKGISVEEAVKKYTEKHKEE